MCDPFQYLLGSSDSPVSVTSNTIDTSTITDGGTGSEIIATPSTTTDEYIFPVNDDHAADTDLLNPLQSNEFPFLSPRAPLSPEPTVLLAEMQKAAEDVSQLVGRFGFKMAGTLQIPLIKAALFSERNRLRLPGLGYADNFRCQLTKQFQNPVNLNGEAPLLWWLWGCLLEWSAPSYSSNGFTLEFTPTQQTDFFLPCKIIIRLWSNRHGLDNIELTMPYGGIFMERRIFDAPVARFRFPRSGFDRITATLAIDQSPFQSEGSFEDMLDYLMPRSGSIWRSAMDILPTEQKRFVQALAGACKANDDFMHISEDNDSQCKSLIRRLPPIARKFIEAQGFIGKERGPYSRSANSPPGPKD